MMTDKVEAIAQVEEALLEFGQEVGYPDKRHDLAIELHRDGVTAADVRLMGTHVTKRRGTEVVGASKLAAKLRDERQWKPLLNDLRRMSEKLARAGNEPGKAQRDGDQRRRMETESDYFGMTRKEMDAFRRRFFIADWRHAGWSVDAVRSEFNADEAEQDSCVAQFPAGRSFHECLIDHVGGETK